MSDFLDETVEEFNSVFSNLYCYNDKGCLKALLLDKAKFVLEEAEELIEAIEKEDWANVLKEHVDVSVTNAGVKAILYKNGFRCSMAEREVIRNNETKFIEDKYDACLTVDHYFNNKGINTTYYYNDDFCVWYVIDENGKLRKPIGYEDVDVSECVPQWLKGE
jgi:hypothetical protein